MYKLPRMHHCSSCGTCCVKYDHHCGMVMNCIGVNNYHLFLQFLAVTVTWLAMGAVLNVKYNILMEQEYYPGTILICAFVLILQGGCTWYAWSMLKWYFTMATQNMHAVE
mmetsp:Transcript_10293/g.15723  ORF Transcript_10293/g.15723 Transcript_10293/m.15723 type:complete len:110 (-) Transcript_10293:424-753(-)